MIWHDWRAEREQYLARENRLTAELANCILQIEHLQDKFGETGTGNTALAHARATLAGGPELRENKPT